MKISELLSNIIKEKPTLFVGAGISFNSGIPTVYPLKETILHEFGFLSEEEIKELASYNIPFESFISSLLSDCSSISKLLDIYSLGRPNLNHYLIAFLSKLGYIKTIITTNFDTLIEQAFKDIGNKNLRVLYTQEHIKNINYNKTETLLIKIHGCATSKRTISTTLNRVSNANGINYRGKIIQKLIENNETKLISMGYSYSDSFDINPVIEKCANKNKHIYIIEHKPTEDRIITNNKLNVSHPLKGFKNTKELCTDFDNLVLEIWREFISTKPTEIKNNKNIDTKRDIYNEILKSIRNWKNEVINEYSEAALYSMIADIYLKASKYDKTEHYYSKAISYSHRIGDIENELHYSLGLAMLHDNRGNYNEVIKIVSGKIKLLDKFKIDNSIDEYGVEFYRMNFLTYLGKALQCQTFFEKSEKPIKDALCLSKKLRRRNNEAYISTLYGVNLTGLEEYEHAITIFRTAEKLYQKIGDIAGLSFNYSETSKLFKEIKDYSMAIEFLNKSLSISRKIGNTANEAIDLSDLAYLYVLNENHTKSKKCFDLAFQLYSKNEDIVGEAICYNNYAHFLYKNGQLTEAINYHEKAIKIFKKYNFIPSLKIAYENLILIYSELNESKQIEYYINQMKNLDKTKSNRK